MVTVKIENGEYYFKLDEILKSKNVSINKLMKETNTDIFAKYKK